MSEYQTESEFARLLALYQALPQKKYVLEIGSMLGRTLHDWMLHGDPGMTLVSIDKIVPPSDGRHADQTDAHHRDWPHWAQQMGATLVVIDGYSQATATIAAVKAAVPYLDFLFIDGGHDYATVKADYLNYAPLVKPGGLIAFHDIQGIADCARLWNELLCSGQYTGFFSLCDREGGMGIGVLVQPDTRPVLHVITPCSRPENLPLLADSLRGAETFFDLHWQIVLDGSKNLVLPNAADFAFSRQVWTSVTGRDEYNVGGKAAVNQGLDSCTDGWVWVLDDDNLAHPKFFPTLAEYIQAVPAARAFAFAQGSKVGGVRPCGPEWMKECSIDQAQFVIRRDLIGELRYPLRYTGDGAFAELVYQHSPSAWRFCPEVVTYYNWLA